MTQHRTARVRSLSSYVALGAVASTAVFSACAEDPPGLFDQPTATGGSGASSGSGGTEMSEAGDGSGGTITASGGSSGKGAGGAVGSGGNKASGGTGNGGRGGSNGPGAGGSKSTTGGTGGDAEAGMGGDDGAGGEMDPGAGGSSGAGGTNTGGTGGSGTVSCVYSSDPAPQGQGGGAGSEGTAGTGGGGGAPAYDISVRVSPTVGKYLTDRNGMTLYIRTSDLPGDCQPGNPPVSRCTQANGGCSVTWPVFDAGARTLDPQLDPNAFGTILRDDGLYQTTYFGWPLYLYLSDTAAGQIVGQGKGKVWYVAEVTLPNVVIMQESSVRYLADGTGHTLYASSADVLGTKDADPVSNCDATCLQTYEPFREPRLYAVQTLEQEDFSMFINGSGTLQVAYKGAPLYRARTDMQGGDLTGVGGTFALVVP